MGVHVPSVRERFVRRAQYLRSDRRFLAHIEDERLQWNSAHPEYAILALEWPPDPPFWPGNDYAAPARLREEMDAAHRETPPAEDPRFRTPAVAEAWERWHARPCWGAFDDWRRLVEYLCAVWWPAENFPNWTLANDHPAARFVSACLVWKPGGIEPEWIRRYGQGLMKLQWRGREITVAHVFAGMLVDDWKELGAEALQAARGSEEAFRARGCKLLEKSSVREVARLLGVPPSTVASWRKARTKDQRPE